MAAAQAVSAEVGSSADADEEDRALGPRPVVVVVAVEAVVVEAAAVAVGDEGRPRLVGEAAAAEIRLRQPSACLYRAAMGIETGGSIDRLTVDDESTTTQRGIIIIISSKYSCKNLFLTKGLSARV